MTITKKPSNNESLINKIISKGGSSTSESSEIEAEKKSNKKVFVQLRLDRNVIDRIDRVIKEKPFKVPRHQWILEALFEKLEREKS